MTAAEIVARLFDSDKGLTPARLQKCRKLAERSGLTMAAVQDAMTPDQRAAFEAH